VNIRHEHADDSDAIRRLLIAAFGGPAEAKLVDELRGDGDLVLALVAEDAGAVVGYVAFSLLKSPARAVALAPLAVAPGRQRQGIGAALTEEALRQLRASDWRVVFVVGAPDYYRRFGFTSEAAAGFDSAYAGPYFMALQLSDDPVGAARVIYSERFAAI
jgi:putative acetyltransferase